MLLDFLVPMHNHQVEGFVLFIFLFIPFWCELTCTPRRVCLYFVLQLLPLARGTYRQGHPASGPSCGLTIRFVWTIERSQHC